MVFNLLFELRRRYKSAITNISLTRQAYKNYLSVIFQRLIGKRYIYIVTRNGYSADIDRKFAKSGILRYILYWEGLENNKRIPFDKLLNLLKQGKFVYDRSNFTYHGRIIKFHGDFVNGDVLGIFFREEYAFLRSKNKVIVDIGANIGDSPIWFAVNGARKVIALEPYPYSYNTANLNIKDNHLNKNIILLNAGYGKDSKLTVDPQKIVNGSSYLIGSNKGKIIPIYSLKSLVEKFHLNNAYLKMDCEGCEYNLLNEDNETLRRFERIQMEFHYGYKVLEKKLRDAGFKVWHRNVGKSNLDNPELIKMAKENNDLTIGYLYAER